LSAHKVERVCGHATFIAAAFHAAAIVSSMIAWTTI